MRPVSSASDGGVEKGATRARACVYVCVCVCAGRGEARRGASLSPWPERMESRCENSRRGVSERVTDRVPQGVSSRTHLPNHTTERGRERERGGGG